MFCPKCGTPNPDTGNWCTFCGNSLHEVPQSPPIVQPVLYSPTDGRLALKRIASGPMFFAATILYLIALVLSLIYVGSGSLISDLSVLYSSINIDLSALEGLNSTPILIGQLVSSAPGIVTFLALGLIFLAAKKSDGTQPISTAGLTILQVTAIVTLCFMGLVAALCLALLVMLIIAGPETIGNKISMNPTSELNIPLNPDFSTSSFGSKFSTLVFVVFLVLLIVMLVTLVLSAVYQALVLRSVRCAKEVCREGTTQKKPSLVLGILCIVSGGGSIASSLSQLLNPLSLFMSFQIVATLASGVATLLFGICLLNFRSALPTQLPVWYPENPAYPPAPEAYQLPQYEDPWQNQQ